MGSENKIDSSKPGKDLLADIGIYMLVEPAGMGDTFRSEFLGMLAGEYVILRIPRTPGLSDFLYLDKKVTVRYVHEGSAYGFNSKVLHMLNTPDRWLVVRYPAEIETLNLRRSERIDCFLPAKIKVIQNCNSFGPLNGMILNLSSGGCQLVADLENSEQIDTELEARIDIKFQMIGSNTPAKIEGIAKNITYHDNRYYFGMMYTSIAEELKFEIEQYIYNVGNYI